MRTTNLVLLAAAGLLLTSCEALTGKEIGRIAVAAPSTDTTNLVIGETRLTLHKNDQVQVWSHMDLEYDGEMGMFWVLRLQRDNMVLQELQVDPMEKNITIGEVRTDLGGHTKWSFTGKNATMSIPEDGNYTCTAILIASNPEALKLTKAELVLKQ
ncbi:MAG: hypothetical protein ABI599_18360 [Flavobacteriales bacterium]